MNILHLVLGCKNDHYISIESAAKDTWLQSSQSNIKTVFLYGNSDKVYWDGKDSFFVDRPESLTICLYKTILAFECFLDSNFDYIFRSNNTGYFDYKLINEFIIDKPKKKFYCGILGDHNNISFASGSGYFLSKDIAEKIVLNKNILFDYNLPGYYDDVCIGKYITQDLKIDINKSARRLDLDLSNISNDIDLSHYHYRILNKGNSESLYKIHTLKNL